MVIYNYTSLRQRDTKIYNLGGLNIAGGLSIEFMKVVVPVLLLVVAIGIIIGIPFNINFYNPFSPNFKAKYTIFWIVVGGGIGAALWYVRFSGYRLYQYLIAYFKPKKVYKNDFRCTEYKLNNIYIKAFIKNIL